MSENKKLAHSLETKVRTKDVILEENVSFKSLLLPEKILRGLLDAGFLKPSPIQIRALPVGRCGFDLTIKSKSGTGKTLVFGIIALETVKLDKSDPQALILVPTREIAVQIEDVLKNIGKYLEGLNVQSFIGGLPLSSDKVKCTACQIAVGTPGRVKQLIQEGNLASNSIKLFVLDEADKLLENSFQNDITEIFNSLPDRKQVIMCSATYPHELEGFLNNYMLSPTFVSAELDTPLLLGLKQFVRILSSPPNIIQQTKVKNEQLLKIFNSVSFTQCLMFSNYQNRAESISNFLNRNGWNCTFISGAQNQTERLSSLSSLKDFKCKILISTDLTSRGIDAANVDLVINYDIPVDAMTYLHRMGRAGRYGSTGNCINLALVGQETKQLRNILGIIGGHDLSMPILDDSLSLENIVTSKENLLLAEVPDNITEFTDTFKREVIEMKKKSSQKSKKKSKESENKSIKVVISGDEKIINKIVEEKLSDMDISSVLNQLASGTLELHTSEVNDKKNAEINCFHNEFLPSSPKSSLLESEFKSRGKENEFQNVGIDPIFLLQQLSQENEDLKISEEKFDDKKRKRSEHSPDRLTEETLKKEQSNDEIFCRNKAMFSVAKTLSNVEMWGEDYDYLTKYLGELKTKERSEATSVLKKNDEGTDTKNKCSATKENYRDVLENIFSLAYKYQVLENFDKWQDYLPEDEKKKLEDNYFDEREDLDEFEEESYDECDNEDYDFEMERDIEVNLADNVKDPSDYSFMKWIPVEPANAKQNYNKKISVDNKTSVSHASSMHSAKNIDIFNQPTTAVALRNESSYYHEQFSPYYKHCSSNLWQTGLTFETIQNFDEWFCYDWQNQVATVRNFVQKKIYLEEMRQFQE